MMEYNIFQWVMLWLGAAGLGIAVITWLTVFGFVPIWNEIRRHASLPRIQQIFVVIFTFGTIHAAATKPIIRFDGGIKPGANKSWVTNDTIHIEWQRDLSSGVYVPETAAVYIDYRPNTETNAEWGLLAQTTVGAWSWEGTLADATNYDYNVWAYYIPPEPVHTNGVWVYKTMMDRPGKHIIPLRARVEVNGQAISTPLAKRRDMPYDAEVEYLESTRTQFIDLPVSVVPGDHFGVSGIATYLYVDSLRYCVFDSNAINQFLLMFYSYDSKTGKILYSSEIGKDPMSGGWGGLINQTTFFEVSTDGKTSNGVWSPLPRETTGKISMLRIFGRYTSATTSRNNYPFRLHELKILHQHKIIYDLIMCRIGSEGMMFDRVSKKLFRNQGTGKFIIGPDKQ